MGLIFLVYWLMVGILFTMAQIGATAESTSTLVLSIIVSVIATVLGTLVIGDQIIKLDGKTANDLKQPEQE